MRFIFVHARENCGACAIAERQPAQVITQVRFDLSFGLANEAEARPIVERAGEHADAKAAGVPKRSQ